MVQNGCCSFSQYVLTWISWAGRKGICIYFFLIDQDWVTWSIQLTIREIGKYIPGIGLQAQWSAYINAESGNNNSFNKGPAQSLSCAQLCDPMDFSPLVSSVHGILQARILDGGLPFSSPGDLPDPGIEPTFPVPPALQADSLPLSHQGSPKKDNKDKQCCINNHCSCYCLRAGINLYIFNVTLYNRMRTESLFHFS